VTVIARNGQRPLHLAAQTGHIEIAKLLLEKGTNVMFADGRHCIGHHRMVVLG
jgi:ankyrin repeat protein